MPGVGDQEEYRDIARLAARRGFLRPSAGALVGFERVRATLHERGLITWAEMSTSLARRSPSGKAPFDFVVVDEAHDLSVAQLGFGGTGCGRPDALFLPATLGSASSNSRSPPAWRRHPRAFPHLARQLPHLTQIRSHGGPPPRPGNGRRRRQHEDRTARSRSQHYCWRSNLREEADEIDAVA